MVRPDPTPAQGPDPYGNPEPEWLRVDWSRLRRITNVPPSGSGDGTEVNWVEMGPSSEEPHRLALVFVHGLSGCWQNWLENIPYFARSHRVLALDLPGFGDSPAPDWEVSVPNYGRLLLDFCDAVGVADCAIVGNSLGGFVAAEAAIMQPGRFEKLILVSAAGVSSARLRKRPVAVVARMMAAGTPIALKAQTRALSRSRARTIAFSGLFDDPNRLRPELISEFFEGGLRGESFVEALTGLAGYDFLDRLEEVEVPTLIIWGRNDRVVPARDALEFQRRLSNPELVVFDNCGHVAMAERPVRFNHLLEEFLAEA